MSSGSYVPPPVKAVPIPKKSGGVRILGIPTVADRIAQTAVKMWLEPRLDPIFRDDSYGYRPGKSALEAIAVTRRRCWDYDWIVEFDIRGLFDNLAHDLLMAALRKHCQEPWTLLYVERWLKAPMQTTDGQILERDKGTPQGGVVSPLLANLFLHYAFDLWVTRHLPGIRFARYADDAVLHCKSKRQAEYVLDRIRERFRACKLELHPGKTRIVYCKDINRTNDHPDIQFTFLGYTFRPRKALDKYGRVCVNFSPAVSRDALKAMRQTIRGWHLQLKSDKRRSLAHCCEPPTI
jgi:RNA-directed DNA polymerase